MLDPPTLTSKIKAKAQQIGFDLVGIAPVRASEHRNFLESWLARGYHGEMSYLARADAVRRRANPVGSWPELKSAVVVGLNYYNQPINVGEGVIARYAIGRDYHKVIKAKLRVLLRFIEEEVARQLPAARAYVDTGPVLERELAQRAGLGWFGRNTMLINPRRGSYFFLGTLLLELELAGDAPFEQDHCGTCNACVSACPTRALLGRDHAGAPVIDARRCISYLTIEQRGPIPRELRPLLGIRIFGCDICQEVCPWNGPKFVTLTREPDFRHGTDRFRNADLAGLLAMDDAAWDDFSRGSAIRRAGRAGFLRNVAVALGNTRSAAAVPALIRALADAEPLLRGHAAWALGQIGTARAREALNAARPAEVDASAREEIEAALAALATARS